MLASALATGLLCASATAAEQASEPARIDVAHSAQLTVEATESDDAVVLWIRHLPDRKLVGSKDVSVTINGRNQVVTQRTDGSYTVPMDDVRGKEAKTVQLIVAHDGIREVLDGRLPPPPENTSSGLLGSHNQLAWWIVNITVLFIGVLALSRRKSY
jgi:hypothetical protein